MKKTKCHFCNCVTCGKSTDPGKLLVCDGCMEAHHTFCLDPPLEAVPEEDWYCPECKIDDGEIIKPGEAEKLITDRKRKAPSFNAKRKNWGGGNSCSGVTNKCSIVSENHVGPVPGVEVGTCWRYRIQVAAAGIHRMLGKF